MLPFDTSDVNSQQDSPLFGWIPKEIRDQIFDLALTAYPGKQRPFKKNAYYYRPGFRYADQKVDTALLRTCRCIYQEAHHVPLQNYEPVEWHGRGPPVADAEKFARDKVNEPRSKSLHLFTQQYWLENSTWGAKARNIARRQHLCHLKITIRHSDWWYWESSQPLLLDAKQAGKGSDTNHSTESDRFQPKSWGNQFSVFKCLETFQLELETVEGKRKELDDIVTRAADWRFPLRDGNVLVLHPAKTKRIGWHGEKLRKCMHPLTLWRGEANSRLLTKLIATGLHAPSDPKEAKERLVKDGVDFRVWDSEPELSNDDCLTYYVVSLTYVRRAAGPT